MAGLRFWIFFTLVFTVLVITGISLISSQSGSPTIVAYTKNEEKPKLEIDKVEVNLGKINVSEEQKTDFFLTNSGTKPLQLFEISSSCGCTTAKIIRENGQESSEYGMHLKKASVQEVLPKEKIKIEVIYRPFVMPVKGPVSRQIYLRTNDPLSPKLTLSIKAQIL